MVRELRSPTRRHGKERGRTPLLSHERSASIPNAQLASSSSSQVPKRDAGSLVVNSTDLIQETVPSPKRHKPTTDSLEQSLAERLRSSSPSRPSASDPTNLKSTLKDSVNTYSPGQPLVFSRPTDPSDLIPSSIPQTSSSVASALPESTPRRVSDASSYRSTPSQGLKDFVARGLSALGSFAKVYTPKPKAEAGSTLPPTSSQSAKEQNRYHDQDGTSPRQAEPATSPKLAKSSSPTRQRMSSSPKAGPSSSQHRMTQYANFLPSGRSDDIIPISQPLDEAPSNFADQQSQYDESTGRDGEATEERHEALPSPPKVYEDMQDSIQTQQPYVDLQSEDMQGYAMDDQIPEGQGQSMAYRSSTSDDLGGPDDASVGEGLFLSEDEGGNEAQPEAEIEDGDHRSRGPKNPVLPIQGAPTQFQAAPIAASALKSRSPNKSIPRNVPENQIPGMPFVEQLGSIRNATAEAPLNAQLVERTVVTDEPKPRDLIRAQIARQAGERQSSIRIVDVRPRQALDANATGSTANAAGTPPIFVFPDGNPMKVYVHITVNGRRLLLEGLRERGATIALSPRVATHVIFPAPPKTGLPQRDFPEQYHLSVAWVSRCLAEERLKPEALYDMHAAYNADDFKMRNNGSGPVKQFNRKAFTSLDDDILAEHLMDCTAGSGKEVYKILAHEQPHHSHEAWRSRYLSYKSLIDARISRKRRLRNELDALDRLEDERPYKYVTSTDSKAAVTQRPSSSLDTVARMQSLDQNDPGTLASQRWDAIMRGDTQRPTGSSSRHVEPYRNYQNVSARIHQSQIRQARQEAAGEVEAESTPEADDQASSEDRPPSPIFASQKAAQKELEAEKTWKAAPDFQAFLRMEKAKKKEAKKVDRKQKEVEEEKRMSASARNIMFGFAQATNPPPTTTRVPMAIIIRDFLNSTYDDDGNYATISIELSERHLQYRLHVTKEFHPLSRYNDKRMGKDHTEELTNNVKAWQEWAETLLKTLKERQKGTILSLETIGEYIWRGSGRKEDIKKFAGKVTKPPGPEKSEAVRKGAKTRHEKLLVEYGMWTSEEDQLVISGEKADLDNLIEKYGKTQFLIRAEFLRTAQVP